MGARADLDRFSNGCRSLFNMYSKSQGPAVRRPGLEFVYNLGAYTDIDLTRRPRIVPFVFGEIETFALIFVPTPGAESYTIYVANSQGMVLDGTSSPVTVKNGSGFTAISTSESGFHYAQIGDILYIAFNNGNRVPAEIMRKDTAGLDWEIHDVVFDYYPQRPAGDYAPSCTSANFTNQADCVDHGGSWEPGCYNITYTWTRDSCRARGGEYKEACESWEIYTQTICEQYNGTWKAVFQYNGKWYYECVSPKLSNKTDCEAASGVWVITCAGWKALSSTDCTTTLSGTWDANSGCRAYVVEDKDVCISFGGTWSPLGSDPWWSTRWGFPTTVSAYQQRLVFAGTRHRPQTAWLSRIQSLLDFNTNVNVTITADQALAFTLASGEQNRIQWLASSRSLLCGTYGDEWTLDGGAYNAITPTNVMALRHTNSGSERILPILVGPSALFVERLGRTVNEFVYDYNMGSYRTNDMTILAPHLTENYSIFDWAYQQTPNSIIWALRNDGTMLGLTYQREQKVVGWHRHETDGFVVAIGSTPGQRRETDVWVVTARENKATGVGGNWCLEKMSVEFASDNVLDSYFLDSFKVYNNPGTAVFTIPHLAGHTVHILADGIVLPPQVASNSGVVTLDKSTYGRVVIGLPYLSEVEMVPVEIDAQDGTTMGRTQRVTKVDVLLHRSLGMRVGNSVRTEEIPFRHPTDSTGSQIPLFSGWKTVEFMEGYDKKSSIVIQQDKPLPLTVIGIVDTIEVNN